MSSQQGEERTIDTKPGKLPSRNHEDSVPVATRTFLDRYTALRNHRMRFQDALDPNAERVTTLRKYDIIFGRGKNMQDYPGNRKMRSVIDQYKQQYHSLERSEKRDLIESVYKELVKGGARFLTKAPGDDHFVVVDIEVALQKVGNTLRCRKSWNKRARQESTSAKKASASAGSNSCAFSPNKMLDAGTNAAAIFRNQAIPSPSHVPPLMMQNQSQTMLLLKANTVRLMKKMPLLPATVNDMCYLQRFQSLQQCLGQLSSTSPQMQMNIVGVGGSTPIRLPEITSLTARRSPHEISGAAVNFATTRKS